jgi:hypothetical protein
MSTKNAQLIRNQVSKQLKCGLYNFNYPLTSFSDTTPAFGLKKRGCLETDIYIFFHENKYHIHAGCQTGVTYETPDFNQAITYLSEAWHIA